MYEDNSGAMCIAKYGNYTKNSKHIEVQYHYVNKNYLDGIVDIVKIESEKDVADVFTKPLGKTKFKMFRDRLRIK